MNDITNIQSSISVKIHNTGNPLFIPLTFLSDGIYCFDPGSFHYDLDQDKHSYVTTGESLNFSVPPKKNLFGLKPATRYVLCGEAVVSGSVPQIWVIEYSEKGRLGHKNLPLSSGPFRIEWTSHPNHKLLVMAIRLQGSGTLALTKLELFENKAKPPQHPQPKSELLESKVKPPQRLSFDFSAPVSPEMAAGPPYRLLPPLRFNDVDRSSER